MKPEQASAILDHVIGMGQLIPFRESDVLYFEMALEGLGGGSSHEE